MSILYFCMSSILYLLTGYEGNSKLIDPEIPTIARGEAEGNSWYRGVNKLTIPRISS
jgi:hypothetical protein